MVVSLRLGPCSSTRFSGTTHPGPTISIAGSPRRDWTRICWFDSIQEHFVCSPEGGRIAHSCRSAVIMADLKGGARMRALLVRLFGSILLAPVLFLAAATTSGAGEGTLLAVDSNRVAIKGYDTVAYFT